MSFVVFSAGGYLNGHTAFCIQCPFTFEYSPAEKKKNNQKVQKAGTMLHSHQDDQGKGPKLQRKEPTQARLCFFLY